MIPRGMIYLWITKFIFLHVGERLPLMAKKLHIFKTLLLIFIQFEKKIKNLHSNCISTGISLAFWYTNLRWHIGGKLNIRRTALYQLVINLFTTIFVVIRQWT